MSETREGGFHREDSRSS